MKNLLIAAAVALTSTIATADELQEMFCTGISEYIQWIAEARDNGVPLSELLKEIDTEIDDPNITIWIYASDLTAETLAFRSYMHCMEGPGL